MKRLLLLAMVLLPMMAIAQHPKFEKLSKRYADVENVTVTNIDKSMLQMMVSGNEDMEGVDHVDNILIIISENKTLSDDIVKRSKQIIKTLKLTPFVSVDNEGTQVDIYCIQENDIITDLIVVTKDDNEGGVVVLSGDIPTEKISELLTQTM